jgi:hypothetical protein
MAGLCHRKELKAIGCPAEKLKPASGVRFLIDLKERILQPILMHIG